VNFVYNNVKQHIPTCQGTKSFFRVLRKNWQKIKQLYIMLNKTKFLTWLTLKLIFFLITTNFFFKLPWKCGVCCTLQLSCIYIFALCPLMLMVWFFEWKHFTLVLNFVCYCRSDCLRNPKDRKLNCTPCMQIMYLVPLPQPK